MSLMCCPLFLLYKLLNVFRATVCPSSGADDCLVLSPPCWYCAVTMRSSHITGLDRPRGFQEVKVPRFRDNGTGGWQVVSPTHRPPLPPGNTPGTHFCQRLSRPQGPQCDQKDFMSIKNPLTPATFRFVAQHLDHCATEVKVAGAQDLKPYHLRASTVLKCAIRRILCQYKIHWHQLGSNQRPSDLQHSTLTTVLLR